MFNLYRNTVRRAAAAGVLGLLILIVAAWASVGTAFAAAPASTLSPQGSLWYTCKTLAE